MVVHGDYTIDELAFAAGFRYAAIADLERVVRAALILEKKMYAKEDARDALFRLRKALEGIWGHDEPWIELEQQD